jgi:nicotinamidase/pyrazinamidase
MEYSEEEDYEIISFSSFSEDSRSYIIPRNDIIICGLAGDYCVLETARNLFNVPELTSKSKILMFMDGINSIDGGNKLNTWMKENGIKDYTR